MTRIDEQYEQRRLSHLSSAADAYPQALEALSWDRPKIRAYQTERLRWLMAEARSRSPFWRERLRDVEDQSFSVEDLRELPVLRKREMMDNWPELITLPGISKQEAYAFLETLDQDRYFHDTYHLVASGGSSGEPALFLYDWAGWLGCVASMGRYDVRLSNQYPELVRGPGVGVNVGAGRASHMTYALSLTFAAPGTTPNLIPVTWPLGRIVERLNELQPVRLSGYPSIFLLLTEEARAGRLTIRPHTVQLASEPLTPEIRRALMEVWDPIIMNVWGCSEACVVANCYGSDTGMYVNEDFVIVEPVDADDKPVPPGKLSEKVLITNLFNAAQPLIRYEVTDQVTVMPEPSPSGLPFFRIEDIQGRTDDVFSYGSVKIHPILFRGPLARTPGMLEFQVRQTDAGARVDYLATAAIDEAKLQHALEAALSGNGISRPRIELVRKTELERVGVGKLKRFFAKRRALGS